MKLSMPIASILVLAAGGLALPVLGQTPVASEMRFEVYNGERWVEVPNDSSNGQRVEYRVVMDSTGPSAEPRPAGAIAAAAASPVRPTAVHDAQELVGGAEEIHEHHEHHEHHAHHANDPAIPRSIENDPSDLAPCNLPEQFTPRSFWGGTLWPGGNVYFDVDAGVTQQNRDRLSLAMSELESVANIRFIPRTTQPNFIHVQNGTGNNSFVGMTGSSQALNMVSWSFRYIIEHEFMHALGIWHEQQRPDRETFVTIVTANIQSGYGGNFTLRNGPVVGPFDFESVMLYDDCSFSTCCAAGSTCGCAVACATILAQPAYAAQQNLMGNRSYLSQGDRDGLANRYGAPIDDAYEENDLITAPLPTLAPGTYANLKLFDGTDFFAFDHTGGTLRVDASAGVWSRGVASVTIYTSGQAVVSSALFADPDADGTSDVSLTPTLAPGRYLVRVSTAQPYRGAYSLSLGGGCDSIDFNNDGVSPDSDDVVDFLSVYGGGPCSTGTCGDIDFNNDGVSPDTDDIAALLRVFAGGDC